jgi:hypothetical protein
VNSFAQVETQHEIFSDGGGDRKVLICKRKHKLFCHSVTKVLKNMASGLSGLQSGLQVQALQSKTATSTSATATTLGGIHSSNGRWVYSLKPNNYLSIIYYCIYLKLYSI